MFRWGKFINLRTLYKERVQVDLEFAVFSMVGVVGLLQWTTPTLQVAVVTHLLVRFPCVSAVMTFASYGWTLTLSKPQAHTQHLQQTMETQLTPWHTQRHNVWTLSSRCIQMDRHHLQYVAPTPDNTWSLMQPTTATRSHSLGETPTHKTGTYKWCRSHALLHGDLQRDVCSTSQELQEQFKVTIMLVVFIWPLKDTQIVFEQRRASAP